MSPKQRYDGGEGLLVAAHTCFCAPMQTEVANTNLNCQGRCYSTWWLQDRAFPALPISSSFLGQHLSSVSYLVFFSGFTHDGTSAFRLLWGLQ